LGSHHRPNSRDVLRIAAFIARFVLRRQERSPSLGHRRPLAVADDGREYAVSEDTERIRATAANVLGRVLGEDADSAILDLRDRFRRVLNVEYAQQQAIANKKPDRKNHKALHDGRHQSRRAFLLPASLIEAPRKRQAAAFQSNMAGSRINAPQERDQARSRGLRSRCGGLRPNRRPC
jgi:hypothetical protein